MIRCVSSNQPKARNSKLTVCNAMWQPKQHVQDCKIGLVVCSVWGLVQKPSPKTSKQKKNYEIRNIKNCIANFFSRLRCAGRLSRYLYKISTQIWRRGKSANLNLNFGMEHWRTNVAAGGANTCPGGNKCITLYQCVRISVVCYIGVFVIM